MSEELKNAAVHVLVGVKPNGKMDDGKDRSMVATHRIKALGEAVREYNTRTHDTSAKVDVEASVEDAMRFSMYYRQLEDVPFNELYDFAGRVVAAMQLTQSIDTSAVELVRDIEELLDVLLMSEVAFKEKHPTWKRCGTRSSISCEMARRIRNKTKAEQWLKNRGCQMTIRDKMAKVINDKLKRQATDEEIAQAIIDMPQIQALVDAAMDYTISSSGDITKLIKALAPFTEVRGK
jgi:hypothetical protein